MGSLDNNKSLMDKMAEVGLSKFLAPAALVILYVFFGLFGRNFFSYSTLVNILDSSYYIGFIAIGQFGTSTRPGESFIKRRRKHVE